ncbi:MAG TPA: hypothetical protein VM820_11900 [Vicinamibacterales bacterium]|nr:hypothetical protein [Vicinamibacterales bacterium]
MRLAELLRLTALGIALMCWLDPPVIIAPAPPVIVNAAVVHSPRDGGPARSGETFTIAEAMNEVARQLSDQLAAAGTLRVHEVSAGDPVPCDALQPCVVITEGAAVLVPGDRKGPLSIVQVGDGLSPNVEAKALSIAPAHIAGQATARVSLAAAGLRGHTSRVRLFDGEAVVGEASHQWTSDGEVALDVPWWPVRAGARTLVARVVTDGIEERTGVDNDVADRVLVEGERWPIVTFERRPSWAATFVRRALESDARFDVSTLTELAPRVSVSTARPAPLGRLDAVRVVVVGAPDALSAEDVNGLDRFIRQRGGAVVLLPDRPITGPATRLVQQRWRERLEDQASAAGPLRASEWLVVSEVGPMDLVWGQSSDGAAIVATPVGAGMVLISGALDAWRHRTADGAHDGFWQATVARLAAGVGATVSLDLGDGDTTDGDGTARVLARTTRTISAWQVTATRTCADGATTVVRMWPADATGAFWGRVPVGSRVDCRLDARVAGVGEASMPLGQPLAVDWSPRWTQASMEAVATGSGGLFVSDGVVGPLVDQWLRARGTERRPEPRYPMRSWWWVLPFVASLSGEWWLRRRAGLR